MVKVRISLDVILKRMLLFVIVACVVLLFKNPFAFWFAIIMIIYTLLKKSERLLFLVALVFLLLLVFLDILYFSLFPQVLEMSGGNLYHYILTLHPHTPRYAVVYPAVLVHRWSGQDIHIAYTMLCVTLMALMSVLLKNIFVIIGLSKTFFRSLFGLGLFTVISLKMNGRLIPAYFGLILILNVFSKILVDKELVTRRIILGVKFILTVFIGFWLTMVSSGTMMVSFILILFMMFFLSHTKNAPVYSLLARTVIASLGITSIIFVLYMTYRNYTYYSGNLYGLLGHGLGMFFNTYKFLIFLTPLIPIFVFLFYFFIRLVNRYNLPLMPVVLSLPISIFCGLFGISTATMVIPSIIILFLANGRLRITLKNKWYHVQMRM